MRDQPVDLFEAVIVEQDGQPLAGSEFTALMLGVDPYLTAPQLGLFLKIVEVVQFLLK